MEYTLNDAVNILFLCGFRTVPTLQKYLKVAGFEASDKTLYRKLEVLNEGDLVEDQRQNNQRPGVLSEDKIQDILEKLEENPEASAPELKTKAKVKASVETFPDYCRKRDTNIFGYWRPQS